MCKKSVVCVLNYQWNVDGLTCPHWPQISLVILLSHTHHYTYTCDSLLSTGGDTPASLAVWGALCQPWTAVRLLGQRMSMEGTWPGRAACCCSLTYSKLWTHIHVSFWAQALHWPYWFTCFQHQIKWWELGYGWTDTNIVNRYRWCGCGGAVSGSSHLQSCSQDIEF